MIGVFEKINKTICRTVNRVFPEINFIVEKIEILNNTEDILKLQKKMEL
jgi:ribosomal protein S3AE